MVSHPKKLGLSSNYMYNIPTKCTHTVEYILFYIKSLLHVSAHTAPSSGHSCHLLRSAYCNVVTLITKHKIYYMWDLQRYLQLTEQYLALCYVLKVI